MGRPAQKLARLWRALKPGMGMGCFGPGYLLAFYKGDICILRSSVCFHCVNIGLPKNGINAIGGDEGAFKRFEKNVTLLLPYPAQT